MKVVAELWTLKYVLYNQVVVLCLILYLFLCYDHMAIAIFRTFSKFLCIAAVLSARIIELARKSVLFLCASHQRIQITR